MELDDLLSQDFDVSDGLGPAPRAALASACQQLDVAPARPSLGAAESMRVEAERQRALRAALATTRELVAASQFDLQVLAVLLRLMVEVDGVVGARAALTLIAKLLERSWGGLDRARAGASGAEREKLDRRRGAYLDAVFAQIYFWLARQRERSAPELLAQFAPDRAAWLELVERVDARLARSSSRVARWEPTRQALEVLLHAPTEPASVEAAMDAAPAVTAISVAAPARVEDAGVAVRGGASAAAPAGAPASLTPSELESATMTPAEAGATVTLEVSPRFWELQRRLRAFSALLDSGQLEKARIVARDLAQAIERFDVAGLFPGLFAGYFELSIQHAQALSGAEPLDPTRSAALSELYRTDLTRFMQLSLERRG